MTKWLLVLTLLIPPVLADSKTEQVLKAQVDSQAVTINILRTQLAEQRNHALQDIARARAAAAAVKAEQLTITKVGSQSAASAWRQYWEPASFMDTGNSAEAVRLGEENRDALLKSADEVSLHTTAIAELKRSNVMMMRLDVIMAIAVFVQLGLIFLLRGKLYGRV